MLPENAFSEKEQIALLSLDLTIEMAVATEWIVRDNRIPDSLMLVYVAPTDVENELQAACSCPDGVLNKPCPHALAVFQEIRDQTHILQTILSRRPPAESLLV